MITQFLHEQNACSIQCYACFSFELRFLKTSVSFRDNFTRHSHFSVKNERESLNGEQAMKMDSHRLQDKTKSTDTSSLNCGQIERVYGVINDVFISLSRCIYSPSFLKP